MAVTGGAGFIGANLVRTLLADAVASSVVVVDDLSSGDRANLAGLDADLVEGSILDGDLLDRAFAGCDAVVHLAARSSVPRSIDEPVAAHLVNAGGTVEVLEAARRAGGPHVVVASSSSVYGANASLPKREDHATLPVSPYGASKLAGEAYALAWGRSYELDVLALRLFNVFGPFQPLTHAYAKVVPAFVCAALAGQPVPLHGDGRQTRDFTSVGDVCAIVSDAVRRRVTSPSPVNVAFGARVSLLELIAELEQVLDRHVDVEQLPERPGDVRHTQADTTALRELFPDVEPTTFRDGLTRTVAWLTAFSTK